MRPSSIASFLLILFIGSSIGRAEPLVTPITPGDMAVSGFSGNVLAAKGLAPGVDPIDKTLIDEQGAALRLFDLATLGGAPAGQEINPQVKLTILAKDIGQVSALAFDGGKDGGATSLFAAATSAYGLNIVAAEKDAQGKPVRLKAGAPGARFMDGQLGSLPGASPGAIWKVDGATGVVSLLADTAFSGVTNSGPGIGDLAFDPKSRNLYASDLDTGLIHRFAIDLNAANLGQFDHGVAGRPARGLPPVADDGKRLNVESPGFKTDDPATWGVTQPERRVHALAVHGGRLYYAAAEGPEIWSVGLNDDGSFAADARSELLVKAEQPLPVTAIAFDAKGRMILAQRGAQKGTYDYSVFAEGGKAQVLRYVLEQPDDPATPGVWSPDVKDFAVGFADGQKMAAGGAAFGYAFKPDGTLDTNTCGATLALTGDDLRDNPTLAAELAKGGAAAIHGVQLQAADLVRPANAPPNQSVFIDFDGRTDDRDARGHVGKVAIFTRCEGEGGAGFPPVAGGGGGGFPPVDGGGGGGGFPPVAGGGGGGAFPPVDGGGGGTTFPPVEGGGGGGTTTGKLTITKTAGVDKCLPKGGCAFNVEVKNNGAEVAGPIVIDENIEAPQAALTGEPNAPWSCTKAAPFKCTHPGPVPSNGTVGMRVVFAPNTAPDVKEVKNCAALEGIAAGPACATLALDPNAPVQTGPIVVTKKGAGKCTAKGPCAFTVTVKNTSNAEVAPVVIDEQIDAPQAVLAGEANAPWKCSKVAPFTCTHPGLKANEAADLMLAFTPNLPDGTKELKNCALAPKSGGGKQAPGGAPAPAQDGAAAPVPASQTDRCTMVAAMEAEMIALKCKDGKLTPEAIRTTCIAEKKATADALLVNEMNFLVACKDAIAAKEAGTPPPPPRIDPRTCLILPDAPRCSNGKPLPDKEGALDFHRSRSFAGKGNSLIHPANFNHTMVGTSPLPKLTKFRPQSFPQSSRLLHLAGGIGGAIGGAVDAAGGVAGTASPCGLWSMEKNGFRVQQNDGTVVGFSDLKVAPDGSVNGNASYIGNTAGNEPAVVKGTATGTIVGSHVDITVEWYELPHDSHYVGEIAGDGTFAGKWFKSVGGPWFQCKPDKLCIDYAQLAVNRADEAKSLHCGFSGPRWTATKQQHLDWCMAQSRLANSPITAEEEARARDIIACSECHAEAGGARTRNDFLVRHGCPGAIPDLTEERANEICRLHPDKPDDLEQSLIPAVRACEAKLKAEAGNAGDAAGAGVANGVVAEKAGVAPAGIAGDAGAEPGANGQAAALAPEQCAVVPIEPEVVPVNLVLTKTATPDCVKNARGNDECSYRIAIKNASVSPFKGKLTVADGLVLPYLSFKAPATWKCVEVLNQGEKTHSRCESADEISLAPQGPPVNLDLTFEFDAALAKPDKCNRVNVALLGTANTDRGDDRASATARVPMVAGPNGEVPCDAVPPPQQDQGNGLAILKSAAAGECTAGQPCTFNIKVTSKTPGALGEIVVVDAPDNPAGLGLAADNALASQPPKPWVCENGIPLRCKHPGPVPAEGLTLPLSLNIDAKAAAKTVRNCASIVTKPGPQDKDLAPEPSCAEVPLKAAQPAPPPPAATGPNLKLAKKADDCVLNAAKTLFECNFNITISNTGNAPFQGPIAVFEEMPIAVTAAQRQRINVTTATPWSCALVGQFSLNCTRGADQPAIAPQGSINMPLTVTVPSDLASLCVVPNSAVLKEPAPGTPSNTVAGDDFATVSALVPNTGCAPTNLSLTKTATPECVKNAAGNFVCSYKISVKNTGQNPFNERLNVVDVFPKSVTLNPKPPSGIVCGEKFDQNNGTLLTNCMSANPVSILPGKALEMDIDFEVPADKVTVDTCKLINRASISSPDGGRISNIDANDDRGEATAKIPMIPGPNGEVPCDPPSLKLSKAANPRTCAKVGGGFRCSYDVAVTSTGPDPFHGPLTLQDTLPAGSTLDKATGTGWTCSSAGVLKCTHAFVDLPVGDKLGVSVSVLVPEANVKPGTCQVTNSVALALSSGPLTGQNFNASATATIDSPLCSAPAQSSAGNLLVKKETQSASCDENTACPFQVTVKNPFDTAIPGPITLYDTPSIGGQPSTQVKLINGPAAPWSCIMSAAPGFQCTHPGPIAPGDSIGMSYALQPLPGSIGTATELKNCSTLLGWREPRNTACATIALKSPTAGASKCSRGMVLTNGSCDCPEGKKWNGRECTGTGQGDGGFNTSNQPVPVASLKISKKPTAASCTDAGGGCTFDITVTNPTNSVFSGPIEVLETIKADGEFAASSNMRAAPPAPWRCNKSNPAQFTCTHPGPLSARQSLTLPVNFGLRADTGAKAIQNCAEIKGGDGPACATIPLTAAAPATPSQPKTCAGGMVLTPAGDCACLPGQGWNGRTCTNTASQPCPAGTIGKYPDCRSGSGGTDKTRPSKDEAPQQDKPRKEAPTKESPKKDAPKKQAPVCPDDRPVGTYPDCCPTKAPIFSKGVCRPAQDKQEAPVNPGDVLGKTCPDGSKVPVWKKCPRGDGGTNGTQRPKDEPKLEEKCPTWAPEGKPPNCHCPAGTVRRGNFCGAATCGPNMTGTPPNCHRICPAGQVNQNESCVPMGGGGTTKPKPAPQPPKCVGDKILINGACRCPPSAPKDIGNNQCDSPSTK